MKDQTYFCKDWLEHPDFKYCIKQTKRQNWGTKCTVCHKRFKLPNMGKQALAIYAGEDKQEESWQETNIFSNTCF